MGFLAGFFNPSNKSVGSVPRTTLEARGGEKTTKAPAPPLSGNPEAAKSVASEDPSHDSPPPPDAPPLSKAHASKASLAAERSDTATHTSGSAPGTAPRCWSFRMGCKAANVQVKRATLSRADRRAKQSALVVRSLIVGEDADGGGVSPSQGRISRSQLSNVKAQLSRPKTANKVIAQLRAMPAHPNSTSQTSTAIHAVCLPYTDEEVDEKHFSHLRHITSTEEHALSLSYITSATIDSVTEAFNNLQIVSLLASTETGLGQPGDGPGLLAGAVPTAETVINGIVQITPQLMALGYTTGKDITIDHTGIYPPTDRMSVLTCTHLVSRFVKVSDIRMHS
jgi:hypothetical protein